MESITLELRPRLRSLNAYISLTENINRSTIKVKLLENDIKLQIEDCIYHLPLLNVKLLPSSLSSLGVTNHWISFRIQTQPNIMYGTFETEIINAENKSNNGFISTIKKSNLPPKNVNCVFLCTCCKNEITKPICFQRILPLPSSDCDPQEWFCCKHSNEGPLSLDPKETDLFYNINYCLINKHIFKENLKLKNSLIHCNRCLSIIGSFDGKELKSLKIWNCCTDYQIFKDSYNIKRISSPLNDFLITVKDTAELITGEKILLEAKDTNSVHFILLRPMESKLQLFTENKDVPESLTLNLKSSFVVKVLYKYGQTKDTEKHNNPDVKYCELALPSILAGMDQLVSSSTRFPPTYRKADDFYIGYLPI